MPRITPRKSPTSLAITSPIHQPLAPLRRRNPPGPASAAEPSPAGKRESWLPAGIRPGVAHPTFATSQLTDDPICDVAIRPPASQLPLRRRNSTPESRTSRLRGPAVITPHRFGPGFKTLPCFVLLLLRFVMVAAESRSEARAKDPVLWMRGSLSKNRRFLGGERYEATRIVGSSMRKCEFSRARVCVCVRVRVCAIARARNKRKKPTYVGFLAPHLVEPKVLLNEPVHCVLLSVVVTDPAASLCWVSMPHPPLPPSPSIAQTVSPPNCCESAGIGQHIAGMDTTCWVCDVANRRTLFERRRKVSNSVRSTSQSLEQCSDDSASLLSERGPRTRSGLPAVIQ